MMRIELSVFPCKMTRMCEIVRWIGMACALCVMALIPASAYAQVVISEFLYDAPGSDDNQEWVEVFNAGSAPVDLSKWKVSDGSNHIFNAPPKNGGMGSLTIQSGAYIILTDDAAAFLAAHPSPSCGVIDTTLALGNTSGTILLLDEAGTTVDSVPYNKDMGGEGDGNTLVRISVSGTGLAARAPSPCTGDLAAAAADTQGQSDPPAAQSQGQSAPVSSYVPPPLPTLFADAGEDKTVIVGADVALSGRAYLRSRDIADKVRYNWNFGDGATAEGASVTHHWEYPGRYAVVLTVAQGTDTASDRIIVTAEPSRLSFIALPDGGVEIGNSAGRDLDLSRWIVRGGWQSFTLPPDTTILSGAALRIGQKTLGFRADASAELQYPNGMRSLAAGQSSGDAPQAFVMSIVPLPPVSSAPIFPPAVVPPRETISVPAPAPASADDASNQESEQHDAATNTAQTASAASALPAGSPWLWGALGIAGIAAASGFAARRVKKDEWEIEDAAETE
mgnify:CR=1 FL=1